MHHICTMGADSVWLWTRSATPPTQVLPRPSPCAVPPVQGPRRRLRTRVKRGREPFHITWTATDPFRRLSTHWGLAKPNGASSASAIDGPAGQPAHGAAWDPHGRVRQCFAGYPPARGPPGNRLCSTTPVTRGCNRRDEFCCGAGLDGPAHSSPVARGVPL
jgi:hypothetical protein